MRNLLGLTTTNILETHSVGSVTGVMMSVATISSSFSLIWFRNATGTRQGGCTGHGWHCIMVTTVPLKGKLPPLVSFLARRVSFLARRFSFLARRVSFLSRITDAFSMAYITRKKPDMCNGCCSAVRWQIDGTVQHKMCIGFISVCDTRLGGPPSLQKHLYSSKRSVVSVITPTPGVGWSPLEFDAIVLSQSLIVTSPSSIQVLYGNSGARS